MGTLYIIGNGFDLTHGLPTKYWDFRRFLELCDWEFLVRLEELFGIAQIDPGDSYVNVETWEKGLDHVLWGALEEKLACPDIEAMVSYSDSVVDQLHLDGGNWGIESTMDAYWEEQYGFVKKLSSYVEAWIKSIDLSEVVPKKQELIGLKEAKVLTFNYTSTLEECYRVAPEIIEHIHGGLEPFAEEPPIMGHGDRQSVMVHRNKAHEAQQLYDEGGTSIENAIADYFDRTLKDTERIIRQKHRFFQSLADVDRVVVLGLSYSDVDFPYLREIKKHLSSKALWIMSYYTQEDRQKLNETIKYLDVDENMVDMVHSDAYFDM